MLKRLALHASLCCLGSVVPALAQRSAPPLSVGLGVAGLSRNDDGFRGSQPARGIVGWIDLAVAPRLMLEGRFHWFPRDEEPDFGTRGGKTLLAMVGARGRFFSSRHVAIDGILETGVVRFTRAGISYPGDQPLTAPRSQLGFDMGLSAELFPESRWTARIDFVQTMLVVPQLLLSASTNGPLTVEVYSGGRVEVLGTISGSVGYRFGRPTITGPTTPVGRTSAGVGVAYSAIGGTYGEPPHNNVSPGGFLSYRLAEYMQADIAFNAFTGSVEPATAWEGGRAMQGLAGVKLGRRLGHVGLFAKIRAGVVSHSAAIRTFRTTTHRTQETSRSTFPALDIGGVVEVDTSSRTFLRFEGGSVASFFRSRTTITNGETNTLDAAPAADGLQMSVGVGWRF
jgi:hypothetical protein